MFLSSFVFCFCHVFVNAFVSVQFLVLVLVFLMSLRSFNSQLHSALSVVGYHAHD